jgi:capsular exopolysaccharide synthesis family protein
MNAVRLQTELKEAFDAPEPPALSIISDSAPVPVLAPAPSEIDEILAAHGRLSVDAAARIKERAARLGEDFAIAARKLKLLTPADLAIARAIRDGVLQDAPSAFTLGAELVILHRPNSVASEQYRSLAARLLTMQSPERLKGISIIPAGAAIPADVAAANAAVAFAQLGKRVLLIDGDLRRPRLAKLFSAGPGAPERLADAASMEDALRETIVRGMWLLAGQAPTPRPEEFLASSRFSAMTAAARAEFDIVLALSAPFGPTAEGQFIWAETKSALVVARRDQTRADELRRLQSTLRQIGAEILGAALVA